MHKHSEPTDEDRGGRGDRAHGPHLTPWSILDWLGAFGHFWSSAVNDAMVDHIDPQPGQQLLDIGAGLGPATVEAAQRVTPGGRVIAVDPSAFMRRVAGTRRLWQRARHVIEIRAGAAECLPVHNSTIDAAWALNAMHHLDNLDQAAPELARVLKPGAALLLIDEDFAHLDHPHHNLHQRFGENDHGPASVDLEHLVTLLTDAGLTGASADRRDVGGCPAFVVEAARPKSPTTETNPLAS